MRLLIIDEHPLFRKALISLLSNNDMEQIEEASSVDVAMKIIMKDAPEMALINIRLGDESGLEIILRTKEKRLSTKFILLSSFISQQQFLVAEKLGVDGYILKDAYPEDILYAVSSVFRGKKYYDPAIIKQNDNNLVNTLTSREKDVLKELGKGLSNEEISQNLYISEHTVKKHVSSILTKFNFNNRSQIVCYVNNIKTL